MQPVVEHIFVFFSRAALLLLEVLDADCIGADVVSPQRLVLDESRHENATTAVGMQFGHLGSFRVHV